MAVTQEMDLVKERNRALRYAREEGLERQRECREHLRTKTQLHAAKLKLALVESQLALVIDNGPVNHIRDIF